MDKLNNEELGLDKELELDKTELNNKNIDANIKNNMEYDIVEAPIIDKNNGQEKTEDKNTDMQPIFSTKENEIKTIDVLHKSKLDENMLENITTQSKNNNNNHGYTKARSKKQSNFGRAVAAFAIVTSVSAGTFGLGLAGGIAITNAYNNKNNVAVASINEQAAPVSTNITKATEPDMQYALGGSTVNTTAIYKQVSPSVVSINIKGTAVTMFNQIIPSESAGSGIIFKQDEDKIYIVTNYHVINGATEANISLDDNIQVNANFVGGNESDDIAIISVNKADMIKAGITDYKIATFADSNTLEVGDVAIAIGNALGEGKTATQGIISGVNKQINIENQYLSVIQTDAAINPGNSGGALVNASGNVIGINTAKLSQFGVEGMGYAIPSNKVQEIIDNILGQGRLENPYLGVEVITITDQIKATYNFPSLGVYVNNVEQNSSADNGGIRQGDIITEINGKAITTSEELSNEIQSHKVGEKLSITIIRNGRSSSTVDVILKNRGLNF